MSETIKSTIARLQRAGFAPERIADILGLEYLIVQEVHPPQAVRDLSWLPTGAMQTVGRSILALRALAKLEIGARAKEYTDEEICFIRHASKHGMTGAEISAALTRLSSPRSISSIAGASKKYGITRLPPGTGSNRSRAR